MSRATETYVPKKVLADFGVLADFVGMSMKDCRTYLGEKSIPTFYRYFYGISVPPADIYLKLRDIAIAVERSLEVGYVDVSLPHPVQIKIENYFAVKELTK